MTDAAPSQRQDTAPPPDRDRPAAFKAWQSFSPAFLPFANAASEALPIGKLLRLSLFQVSVGMAAVLLNGALNRVMIVEMGMAAWLVALAIALPIVIAPFRALIGYRSDMHRSVLGWRRTPYLWIGTLLQWGGLGIMPFALFLMSGDGNTPAWVGTMAAALAFLMVGAGMHTVQTAGLALATDLAPEESRPRVVALLYVMLLLGMVGSALAFGALLEAYSQLRLIQVIQGAALVTLALNMVALWKQEVRRPDLTRTDRERPSFRDAWATFAAEPAALRLLLVVGLGTVAFAMQEILLEPYGGEILGLSVGQTTMLTALLAGGSLIGFGWAARSLTRGGDAYRLAAYGVLIGLPGFSAIIFSAPMESGALFRVGTFCIGLGAGLFAVGTLTAAMALARAGGNAALSGLALGAWGAVQATAMGGGIALGGALRDLVGVWGASGALGPGMSAAYAGYSFVYHLELLLLFATLIALGPLCGSKHTKTNENREFGLAEFPG